MGGRKAVGAPRFAGRGGEGILERAGTGAKVNSTARPEAALRYPLQRYATPLTMGSALPDLASR
jgi:hypothetical protein